MAISIIIPTYNSMRFLAETLDSVSKQERLPDEVIVVDDNSTDGTVNLTREWASKQPFPVKLLVNKFQNEGPPGPAGGRQTGLEQASGDMIALLDHDDLMLPLHLRVMEQALLQHPEVILCFGDAIEFQDGVGDEKSFLQGKSIEDAPYVEEAATRLRLIQEPLINSLVRGSYIPTAANLFRKQAALDAGGFRPFAGSCDDVLFFLSISRKGASAYYPFSVARKRNHTDNLSNERHTLQHCWNYFMALRSLHEHPAKWKFSQSELGLLDTREKELSREILYHASRKGLTTFMKHRAKLRARMGKEFLIGAARAMFRSSRLMLDKAM